MAGAAPKRLALYFALAASLGLAWLIGPGAFNAVFALIVLRAIVLFLAQAGAGAGTVRGVALLGGGAALLVGLLYPRTPLWPYLAIVSANLVVAHVFGNALLRARPPFLVQFVRQAHGGPEISAEFGAFLRRQCMAWVVFALICAALGLGAMVSPAARPLANAALGGLLVVQILWFAVSHKYAQYRYARPETWQSSLRLMSKPETWKNLDY